MAVRHICQWHKEQEPGKAQKSLSKDRTIPKNIVQGTLSCASANQAEIKLEWYILELELINGKLTLKMNTLSLIIPLISGYFMMYLSLLLRETGFFIFSIEDKQWKLNVYLDI